MKRLLVIADDASARHIAQLCIDLPGVEEFRFVKEHGAEEPGIDLGPAPRQRAVPSTPKSLPAKKRSSKVSTFEKSEKYAQAVKWIMARAPDETFNRKKVAHEVGIAETSGYYYNLFKMLIANGVAVPAGREPGRGGVEIFKRGSAPAVTPGVLSI